MIAELERSAASVGWLHVSQIRGRLTDLSISDLDALLIYSSVEPRCLAPIALGNVQAREGILVRFAERASHERRKAHDVLLNAWLQSRVLNVKNISEFDSTDWRQISETIIRYLADVRKDLGRPLAVGIDISCCPKSQFLSVLASGISCGLIGNAKIFYSTAKYLPRNATSLTTVGEDEVFSKGVWQPAMIPFLEGEIRPGHRRTIVASLGYEAQKARLFLRSYQPDKCVFVLPEAVPEDEPHLYEIAAGGHERYRSILSDFDATSDQIINCPAGDVVRLLSYLQDNNSVWDNDEAMLFALGTKPHALAFGLHAIAHPRFSVVPRTPEAFLPMGNEHDGGAWIYEVKDLSAPF